MERSFLLHYFINSLKQNEDRVRKYRRAEAERKYCGQRRDTITGGGAYFLEGSQTTPARLSGNDRMRVKLSG
jgi:hypothetical protein